MPKVLNLAIDTVQSNGDDTLDDLIEFEEITDYVIENGVFKRTAKPETACQPDTKKIKLELDQNGVKSEMSKKKKKQRKKKNKSNDKTEPSKSCYSVQQLLQQHSNGQLQQKQPDDVSSKIDGMENWLDLRVPDPILRCLKELGFTNPTPIQSRVLPSAIEDKMDIIGAAETGSGKTLAFAIPIVTHILNLNADDDDDDDWDDYNAATTAAATATTTTTTTTTTTVNDDDDEEEESDGHEINNIIVEDVNEEEEDDGCTPTTITTTTNDDDDDGNDDEDGYDGDDDNHDVDNDDEIHETADGVDTIDNDNDTDVDEESQRDILDVDDINDEEDDDDDEVLGKMHNDDKNDHHHHDKPMYALVITPTRELAIQIREHIDNVTKYTDVKCLAIVGGMSIERQNRLLKKFSPQIVVATPGRFWELVQQKCPHLSHVKDLRFLVIDEADRMIEKNHFEELEKIMNYINLNSCSPLRRQNFVFSATLTFIHKTPYRFDVGKKKMKELTLEDKLASLQRKLHMSSKPEVVDLTGGQKMTAQKLTELRVNCTYQEKDVYLYYFLKNNKGRTLVFANSKDCIRRLTSLLSMLHCKPLPLHADMHQKQRLKNLDRFKENERGLLLATDVAARGLDIPNVKHVIHYQVPRTTENYVHRSGRTARSNTAGISLALVCPEEVRLFNGIQAALKRDKDIDRLDVDRRLFDSSSHLVKLARNIESQEHRMNKEKVNKDWIKQACRDADLLLPSDEDDENGLFLEDETVLKSEKRKKLSLLKQELDRLLGVKSSKKKKKTKKSKSQSNLIDTD